MAVERQARWPLRERIRTWGTTAWRAVGIIVLVVLVYSGIVAAGFAGLVALASGGLGDAVALLVVIVVAQRVIRMLVGNRINSDLLGLHPLPSVCGVALGGVLRALLSAPALAFGLAVSRRVAEHRTPPTHLSAERTP